MDPYVFAVMERNAHEARVRAAPHTWYLREVRAERADARRSRRLTAMHAILWKLRRHTAEAPVPASAGPRL